MIFKSKSEEVFNVKSITSGKMEAKINECARIYAGAPDWISNEDHVKTINFAKSVCSETARLATLATGIQVSGSARADWIQQQVEKIYFKLRDWVEYGCAYGTIILKPNGKTVDLVTPGRYIVTDQSNGEITGIVFVNQEVSESGKKWYTRLEYHRFVETEENWDISDGLNGKRIYAITNKCYVGNSKDDAGKPISIEKTPWAGLLEEVAIQNVDKPLYGVLKTPHANNIDIDSPLGLPVFYDAIEELKDLDIAYSRNAKEVFDSKRTVLLDSDRLVPSGGKVSNTLKGFEQAKQDMRLPDYLKIVYGSAGKENLYEEINPELNTDTRLTGMNALLSQIGYKVGFSNGYFVFDEKTGMVTATQVESDDRRTIQFVKDVRDKLEACLDGLIYAMNVFADLYDLAPVGVYEIVYDFGDITYNREEDRARWYGYVTAGRIPFWYYLTKFEGYSEEEARALEEAARPKEPTFFGEEE